MLKRWFKVVFPYAFFAAGVAGLTMPAWLALMEPVPLTYNNVPFPVEEPVRVDEALRITVDRCNHTKRPIVYTFSRTLTNARTGGTWALVSGGSEIIPGCQFIQSRLNILPDDLPPGRYVLAAVTSVQGNYKEFSVPWHTQPFEVVP